MPSGGKDREIRNASLRGLLGRGKRLNCVPRVRNGSAGAGPLEVRQGPKFQNLDYKSGLSGVPPGALTAGFFTESLILAQNERWRRV